MKNDDIDAIIKNAVGLEFEQFCRTTMLAQGEFTKFLKSDDDDKSDILEKITGTGIYSIIGRQIYIRTGEKKSERDKAVQDAAAIKALSDDDRAGLNTEKQKLDESVAELTAQKNSLVDAKNWLLAKLQFENDIKAAQEKLQTNILLSQSADFIEKQRFISDYKTAADAIKSLAKISSYQKNLNDLHEKEITYGLCFKDITNGDLFRNGVIDNLEKQLADVDDYLKTNADKAGMFAESQLITERLQQYVKAQADAAINIKNAEDIEQNELPGISRNLKAENEKLLQKQAEKENCN